MYEADTRLQDLCDSITENARKKAESVISEAELLCQKIKSESESYSSVSDDAELTRLKNEYSRNKSLNSYNAHKELLTHRMKLTESFFSEIKERLLDYSKSGDYEATLMKLLDKANEEKAFTASSVVYVSKRDMSFSDKIKKKYNIEIKSDNNILIGGVLVEYPEDKIVVDETLDSRFETRKKEFASHNELSL